MTFNAIQRPGLISPVNKILVILAGLDCAVVIGFGTVATLTIGVSALKLCPLRGLLNRVTRKITDMTSNAADVKYRPRDFSGARFTSKEKDPSIWWRVFFSLFVFLLLDMNRDGEIEDGPFIQLALEPDAPALQFDQILGDAQAQPGAGDIAHLLIG
jgi:hypothetical protein